MTSVIELLRVSTETQAAEDRAGLPAQRATNRRTAAEYGLTIIETVEIVESGAEVARTPGMARVLEAIASGRAQGVVLAEYSRLFRPDRWTDLAVLQTFADHGALLYLPSGPIDLRSEPGFVQASVHNLLAALERRRIRERMERGKEEIRRRGGRAAGFNPMGLEWDRKQGWRYTPEIERVKMLFRLYLSGEERRYKQLGERVGLKPESVRAILRNPIYCGWRVYQWKRDTGPTGTRISRSGRKYQRVIPRQPDEIVRVRLDIEPIITEAEWQQVQEIMALRGRRRTLAREGARERYLYRGMLACRCGLSIYGLRKPAKGRIRFYYSCRAKNDKRMSPADCDNVYMRVDRLESALDDVIQRCLTQPDVIVAAVEAHNSSLGLSWRSIDPDTEALEQRRVELLRKEGRVIDAYVDGLITKAERDRRLAAIEREGKALAELAAAPGPRPAEALDADAVLAMVGVLARWRHLNWSQRRRILEALAPSFVVWRYSIDGVYLPLQSGQNGMHRPLHTTPATRARAAAGMFHRRMSGLYVPLGAVA